jgi:hypothetical protein
MKESVCTKLVGNSSQTIDDHTFDRMFNNLANDLRNASYSHISDIFSQSISNSDFDINKNCPSRLARDSPKQFWEECCLAVDNIGTIAVK